MSDTANNSLVNLFEKSRRHFNQELPFVLYNKPNSDHVIGVLQRNDYLFHVETYGERGFMFAPFKGENRVLIPEDQSEVYLVDFEIRPRKNSTHIAHETIESDSKVHFTSLVKEGIDAINKDVFKKVVLSRKETIEVLDFDLIKVFQEMLIAYPTAFVYCFFHPKVGLWLGAFSEQLVKIKNQDLKTMAVAGTQVYHKNKVVVWEAKEKLEQQYVTDFIAAELSDHLSERLVSDPYTLQAGNLIHLKSDIQGKLRSSSELKEVLAILHPTPATCGFPKEAARDFILHKEGYERGYYSGFLGELNVDFESSEKQTDLYVNLRCMEVESSSFPLTKVHLYVGCGITKDSIPEKEWEETRNKSMTMKQVINVKL